MNKNLHQFLFIVAMSFLRYKLLKIDLMTNLIGEVISQHARELSCFADAIFPLGLFTEECIALDLELM